MDIVALRLLRKSKGLSSHKLAAAACERVSSETIKSWEQGRRTPDPHRLAYYVAVLQALPDASAPVRRVRDRALYRALP